MVFKNARETHPTSKGKEKELISAEVQDSTGPEVDRSLDERKLDYVQLVSGDKARTPSSINKEISAFLARNRARNDASNRSEFLLSLSEKRKRLQESSDTPEDGVIPSCARTDARTIDREAQMKYDIAKNDEGPLRRTKAKKGDGKHSAVQLPSSARVEGSVVVVPSDEEALSKHLPGVDERLANIETHLAVRYVPSPPKTLWARLKFLEDHIIRLEKDYPPWAALHFNQPDRGWPPPPRATPIIVPPHLRSSDADSSSLTTKANTTGQQPSSAPPLTVPGGSKPRNTKSSLQRAVMERLEVKQAMGENADFDG
ncbi:MAP3K12-binding inhibitory protein 1 [Leucoagaricus sp. SymC.cos]|nr:MAP3K12-binding inhibitory protein 1 [Leucoagaricus sp. SymC.cos]